MHKQSAFINEESHEKIVKENDNCWEQLQAIQRNLPSAVDIDFNNAAGFAGVPAEPGEAHYIVYYLSHAMMFCTGALIEAHVVITPASCVLGERFKFQVFGGTHTFEESKGSTKCVQHVCTHQGYNHTDRWHHCAPDNLALLVLNEQYPSHTREPNAEFIINRVRYGSLPHKENDKELERLKKTCEFYGWGSMRNGYLVPLVIKLRRVDVKIMEQNDCPQIWNHGSKYLCLSRLPCKDDLGSVLVCSGFLRGMMTSLLLDRPCGVGFIDLNHYHKFISCGVDDSRDVLGFDNLKLHDFETALKKSTPTVETEPAITTHSFAPE